MKTQTVSQPVLEDTSASEEQPAPTVDRRAFFRLIGAAAVPLVVPGCGSDEDEDWGDFTQLRQVNPELERSITVGRAKGSQTIQSRPEELSIDLDDFEGYLRVGDQCRVVRSNGNVALFTVGEDREEKDENLVRMSTDARKRLGTTKPFSATLYTKVAAEGLTDEEADEQGEFVERLVDPQETTWLVLLAPHAGEIERWTDDQAEYIRTQLVDEGIKACMWACKGYGPSAFARWHITATALSRHSFHGLDQLYDRGFTHALAFHGARENAVFVGGTSELRDAIRDAIEDALVAAGAGILVTTASGDEPHSGDSPDNVVNELTADGFGGIQISCGWEAREQYRYVIAQAVLDVLKTQPL